MLGWDQPHRIGDRRIGAGRHLQTVLTLVARAGFFGRIYVQDSGGGSPYWLQLPSGIKLRAADRQSFGGRKKLKLDDLEIGQRLVVTLRRSDGDIRKVRVRAAQPAGG